MMNKLDKLDKISEENLLVEVSSTNPTSKENYRKAKPKPDHERQNWRGDDNTEIPKMTEDTNLPCRFCERTYLFCKVYWKTIFLFAVPIIFSPIIINNYTPDYNLIYLTCIMAVFWTLAILPLPVTSLIPIVFYPTMGILDSDKTVTAYTKEVIFMFFGSLIIAIAIQNSHLPKRLALKAVLHIGCSHYRLIYSLSLVTMVLSMWISNSAATSMMLPIITAVLEVLEENGICQVYHPPKILDEDYSAPVDGGKLPTDITICYFLMIAYSSSIGGMGTLVGTPTNMVFKGIFEGRFPNAPIMHFAMFMAYCIPAMILIHLCTYMGLIFIFLGWLRPSSSAAKSAALDEDGESLIKSVIQGQYKSLGPMTFNEKCATIAFSSSAILLFTKSPGFFTGWEYFTREPGYVRDSFSALLIIVIIFLLPSNLKCLSFFNVNKGLSEFPTSPTSGMLTWDLIKQKVFWELLFLLGAGLSMAKASKECGCAALLYEWGNRVLGGMSPFWAVVTLVCWVEVLTEVTSNMAIASIALPVVAEVAVASQINPIRLMLPVALACSFAFHTPVGTSSNAMVMAYANIPRKKMMVGGILPTASSAIILILSCTFYIPFIQSDLLTFPSWAKS